VVGRDEPAVSVIIVNWNTRDHLQSCLESVAAYGSARAKTEVIVVDNGSSDGSAAHVRSQWPVVRLIENPENEGFTRANNRAIRVSGGEYLLLINSDARLTSGALDAMLRWMEEHPQAAVVGPRLVYGNGTWQRATAGRAPSLRTAINHHLCLDRLAAGHPRFAGLFLARDVREPFCPDWVSSACMLVRRRAMEQVGLFDERLFVYMDDVDLCQRLREADWQVWYYPNAVVVHYMSQSTTREPGEVAPAAVRAFNVYFAGRHGRTASAALRAVETFGALLRALGYTLAAAVRPNDRYVLGRARSYWRLIAVTLEPVPRSHSSAPSSSAALSSSSTAFKGGTNS
jgi:GT2 family glycosyltransferase